MRIDEVVTLSDVLRADQYLRLLRQLKINAKSDINAIRIKNKVIKSWKQGMKNRKHFEKLLSEIDMSLENI